MDRLDCVVIGAGLSGLATARSLSECGREVVVLEAESEFGTQSSSRNSEVIHAGIYYPNDTLKATLCVTGKAMLYRYCEEHGVPFFRTGKVIVATSADEEDTLHGYQQQAVANGVNDLQLISGRTLTELEPAVNGQSALLSPSTGIVNSHDLMVSLIGVTEAHGGSVIYRSPVTGIAAMDDRLTITVDGDTTILCNAIVNAAGLRANDIAAEITGFPTDRVPRLHLSIGHYYAYQGRSPFKRLVYPVASGGGLGIHATLDLAGAVRFGPDVRPLDVIDYKFDDSRREQFITSIRKYFPDLDADRLLPAYTGIRPKLVAPGQGFADFCIQGPKEHGIPGLVNLFGIESPGLTASLAIGEYARKLVASN